MRKVYPYVVAFLFTPLIGVSVHAATEYTYTNFDVAIDGVTVTDTYALGIDGNNIVGYYYDYNNANHGFQATALVPLPTSAWMGLALLAGIGGYGVVRRRIRGY